MLVAHDPGHGCPPSPDGTVHNGIVERDYVLELATDIMAAIPWAKHLLLRTDKEGPPYSERAKIAEAAGAQLLLCHHVNAFHDDKESGLLAFYVPGDKLGWEVASALVRAAPADLWQGRTRAIAATQRHWPRVYGVLEQYRNRGLPSVLIEWGFATSPSDAEVLLAPSSRPALTMTAAVGVARAFEVLHTGAPLPSMLEPLVAK